MAYRSSTSALVTRTALATRIALGIAVVVTPTVAHAFEPDHRVPLEPPTSELMRQGVEQRRAGHDAEALATFRKAEALAPSPRLAAQIGLAEQALNMWVEAEEDLSRALSADTDAWISRNRETLERALRLVGTKLGWVTVQSNVPNATLYVGGRSLGPLASQPQGRARVVAGQTTIELRAEGREPVSKSVLLVPESDTAITINLAERAPSSSSPTVPTTPEESPGGSQRLVGWVTVGASVLAVAVGAGFGARAISLKSDRDAACASGCTQAGVDADRDGRSAALVSTIAMGVGVVGLGVGTFLVLTAPKNTRLTAGLGRLTLGGSF